MNGNKRIKLIRRYVIAYLSLVGIFCAFAIVSVAQGAGWRPALAGMPLYAIIFFDHVYLGKGNNQIAQEKPGERRRYIIMMLQAIEQAVSGASRRRRFFLHIATVLVFVSMFRGNNWQAILFKIAMLAAGYLIVFLFELWKGWRAVTGKAPLGSAQLWKNFFYISMSLTVIYIGAAVFVAIFAGSPDGLALLFPLYSLILCSFALALFWELRDVSAVGREDDAT